MATASTGRLPPDTQSRVEPSGPAQEVTPPDSSASATRPDRTASGDAFRARCSSAGSSAAAPKAEDHRPQLQIRGPAAKGFDVVADVLLGDVGEHLDGLRVSLIEGVGSRPSTIRWQKVSARFLTRRLPLLGRTRLILGGAGFRPEDADRIRATFHSGPFMGLPATLEQSGPSR